MTKTYLQFVNESFKNFIGGRSAEKALYADQVWDILQTSYASIGGIAGSGFQSKDDMIENIPFWKLSIKDGKVHAAALYKDKAGRKTVAIGADGSDYGKAKATDMLKNDIKRSYGEVSKAPLAVLLKSYPKDVLEQFLRTPQEVVSILRKSDIHPISKLPVDEWPADAIKTIEKFPWIEKYGYIRKIGPGDFFKVLFGAPGNKIV